jgi:hypothetical protein
MSKEMKNMCVSFNLSDPFQKQMKEYAEQFPNFSGYIKRLIQRDMEGGVNIRTIKKPPIKAVSNQVISGISGVIVKP